MVESIGDKIMRLYYGEEKQHTLFNDFRALGIALVYFMITRLGLAHTALAFLIFELISFALRLIATVLIQSVKWTLNLNIPCVDPNSMSQIRKSIRALYKCYVPTFVVFIYGFFLVILIVLIILLLKEDIMRLQGFIVSVFGADQFSQVNLKDFDLHFNRYLNKSVEYMEQNMNTSLSQLLIKDEQGGVTFVDYAKRIFDQPSEIINTSQSVLFPMIQQYAETNSLDLTSILN